MFRMFENKTWLSHVKKMIDIFIQICLSNFDIVSVFADTIKKWLNFKNLQAVLK